MAQNTAKPSPGTLWYRRTVVLPRGNWKLATFTLKGARFDPEVYVDGERVEAAKGGMAPITIALHGSAVAAGYAITLEIALRSPHPPLPSTCASSIPQPVP